MKTTIVTLLILLAAISTVIAETSVTKTSSYQSGILFDYWQVGICDVSQTLAKKLGFELLVDRDVDCSAKVTITTPKAVKRSELLKAYDLAISHFGYSLSPKSGEAQDHSKKEKTPMPVYRLHRIDPGKESASPITFMMYKSMAKDTMIHRDKSITTARIVPNFINGVLSGYRIYSIKPGSIWEKMEIKNGDIIQFIDGKPLTNPEASLTAFRALGDGKQHVIFVVRRREQISILYKSEGKPDEI